MPLSSADAARLLDALPVGALWVVDQRIAYANPPAAALLARPAEALVGQSVWPLLHGEEADRLRARYAARTRGEDVPTTYELDLTRPDGARVHAELSLRLLGPNEAVVTLRDLGRQARDAALVLALSSLAERVQRGRSVPEVLAAAGRGLAELGIRIHVARLQGERMEVVYSTPDDPLSRFLGQALGRPVLGSGRALADMPLVAQALAERRSLFIDDVPQMAQTFFARLGKPLPPQVRELAGQGYARCVLAPLLTHKEAWGLAVLAGDALTSADAAALSLFCAQLATALEVAEAIDRLQRTNHQLEAMQAVAEAGGEAGLERLVPALLDIALAATRSDRATAFLVEGQQLVRFSTRGLAAESELNQRYARLPLEGDSLPARICREGKARAVSVREWGGPGGASLTQAGLVEMALLPLRSQGRLSGALSLGRAQERPYTPDELRAAEHLAGQVAVQVERARLLEEHRRRVQELSLLNEMGGQLTQHLEPEAVYRAGVRGAATAVGVDQAFLLLLSEDSTSLVAAAAQPASLGPPRLSLPPPTSPSLVWQAIREQRPLASADARTDPRVSPNLLERYGFRGLLAVPLLSRGKPVGALLLADSRAPRTFSAAETEVAVAAANQLAAAVVNARLFEEERRRVEELGLLLGISQVITGSLDADEILTAAALSLAQMIDCDEAFIWLFDPRSATLRGSSTANPVHREHFRSVSMSLQEQAAAARCMVTREVLRIRRTWDSPLVNKQLLERYRVHSLLAIPLLLRDEAIGAVTIGDTRRERPFTEAEVERATVVARQVAVAVANARLFEDLKRSYDELARAQAELVKRERLAALGELAAVVAHEVRNPLGVIFNSVTSLKKFGPEHKRESTMLLEMMGEEADRLNRIVGDLLDFARPHEAELRPERLETVLHGAREAAAAIANPAVELAVELEDSLAPVPVDSRLLRQALLNLVVNAIQAMPRGGRVVLRAGQGMRQGRPAARIEVCDTGPGIPRAAADRIFQPFFTTKATGTGLGLAVVKRIVEAHHGEITVDSTEGQGSTFTLWLPT